MNLLCMVNSDGSVGGQPLVLRTEELACRARDAGDTNATPRREDLLEEETANHPSILAWRIPWTEEGDWRVTVHGVAKSWR